MKAVKKGHLPHKKSVMATILDYCTGYFHYQDVTDNKTTDNSGKSGIRDLSPVIRMNSGGNNAANAPKASLQLSREEDRLKTFVNRWPLRFMDMKALAKTGMYYLGTSDNVKCSFCGVEIGRWEVNDDPVQEHLKWSPNCPLLMRRPTTNVAIDAASLDELLPPVTYDVCGITESGMDVRPYAYAESSISSSSVSPPSTDVSCSSIYPDHPEYAVESARLRSFAEWPRTMKQKPEDLAEAGFFYTKIGDRVKCFSCGGGLKDWDESDDPWEQHALWLGNCHYLKLIKGEAFVGEVQQKHKQQTAVPVNPTNTCCERGDEVTEISPSTEQLSVQTLTIDNQHNDEAIMKLKENKYSNNEIKNTSSKTSGTKKLSEEKLCKICYNAEYNTAFLPCGHVVACAKCASSVTKCPVCRKPYANVMRVYFS